MIDLPHDLSSDSYDGAIEADKEQTAMNRYALDFSSPAANAFAVDSSVFDPRGKLNVAATAKGERHNRAPPGDGPRSTRISYL